MNVYLFDENRQDFLIPLSKVFRPKEKPLQEKVIEAFKNICPEQEIKIILDDTSSCRTRLERLLRYLLTRLKNTVLYEETQNYIFGGIYYERRNHYK